MKMIWSYGWNVAETYSMTTKNADGAWRALGMLRQKPEKFDR